MPPHGLTHPDKLEQLISEFEVSGFNSAKSVLTGYYWKEENKVQLISGSHRWLAARYTQVDLPVKVYPFDYIQTIWGTDEWIQLLHAHE